MAEYKAIVWANVSVQGANWQETVDLVEDLGINEADAAAFVSSGGEQTTDEIDKAILEFAVNVSNFECGAWVPDADDKEEKD